MEILGGAHVDAGERTSQNHLLHRSRLFGLERVAKADLLLAKGNLAAQTERPAVLCENESRDDATADPASQRRAPEQCEVQETKKHEFQGRGQQWPCFAQVSGAVNGFTFFPIGSGTGGGELRAPCPPRGANQVSGILIGQVRRTPVEHSANSAFRSVDDGIVGGSSGDADAGLLKTPDALEHFAGQTKRHVAGV